MRVDFLDAALMPFVKRSSQDSRSLIWDIFSGLETQLVQPGERDTGRRSPSWI